MNKSTVIICTHCKGNGYKVHNELYDYHKGLYDTTYYECKRCEGSGRLVETTTTVCTPFKPEEVKFSK